VLATRVVTQIADVDDLAQEQMWNGRRDAKARNS
jgi:hypothetical protein